MLFSFSGLFLPYYLVSGISCHSLVMSDTVGCHLDMFLYASMVYVGTLRASPAALPACSAPRCSPQPCPGPRTTEPPGPPALVPAMLPQGWSPAAHRQILPHLELPGDPQRPQLTGRALKVCCSVLVTNINTGACEE